MRVKRTLRAGYSRLSRSRAAWVLRAPGLERVQHYLTATRVSAGDVHEVIDALVSVDAQVWLIGGWACDAVIGRETRTHADLDLVLPAANEQSALDKLTRDGFTIYKRHPAGLLNEGVDLMDRRRRRVSLHFVDIDLDVGGGWEASVRKIGRSHGIAIADVFAWGTIDGRDVPCLSVAAQLALHTGYEPQAADRRDVGLLCSHFSLSPPRGYDAAADESELTAVAHALD